MKVVTSGQSVAAADRETRNHSFTKNMKRYFFIPLLMLVTAFQLSAQTKPEAAADSMLIRISEIEVHPRYLKEYLAYASMVGATSVKEEPGVICIYPMQMKRNSTQIRILEIYASPEAYRHHIQTAHFRKYKTDTLHMVKSLDLVDMHALDPASMPEIFLKMKENE